MKQSGFMSPRIIILAGPNGAGKTTSAPDVLAGSLEIVEFVNADVIASGISGFAPEQVSLSAGKVMLKRIHELGDKGVDFAFETTLASRSFHPFILKLKKQKSYQANLVFLSLDNPDIAVERVRHRVRTGGHHVPEEVIRRRYESGLKNFFQLYMPISDEWYFYNNTSSGGPRMIAKGQFNRIERVFDLEFWDKMWSSYGKK